jgi:hypothetical protein
MLEIDKIQGRFSASAQQFLKEYARDFLKSDTKKVAPPNPPIAPEPVKDLFDNPIVERKKTE